MVDFANPYTSVLTKDDLKKKKTLYGVGSLGKEPLAGGNAAATNYYGTAIKTASEQKAEGNKKIFEGLGLDTILTPLKRKRAGTDNTEKLGA